MNRLFANYIKTNEITFKHALGASVESGKEFHTFHEIIYFLDGDGELITENEHTKLKPNTLIIIPKETYHQLIINHNPEHYYRSVLQFCDFVDLSSLVNEKLKRSIVLTPDKNINHLFKKLISATKKEIPTPELFLKSVLTLLLYELPTSNDIKYNEFSHNSLIKEIIKFVNQNITNRLSLKEIANNFNISESSLSHLFFKEMNIPLHRFIIKKRLINAYQMILSGTPATVAAIECGFNDYSGFYKQYKKMFGFAPNKTPN